MKYEIAIPSYKRPKIIREKTLKTLIDIPVENITIFVRNQDELDDYIKENGIEYNYIITEACGLGKIRNYMRDYYEDKELDLVLFIDDDIDKINEWVDKKTLKPVENLIDTIQYIYEETKKRNLNYFGIPGYDNPFFMSDTITSNLKLMIGGFNGIIEPHKATKIHCSCDHGEDYEFTIKHFLSDGGICRFNKYCLKTKNYSKIGGMAEDMGGIKKRNEIAKDSLTQLETEYPDMCKVVQKKNGMWDIKLNYRYSRGKKITTLK